MTDTMTLGEFCTICLQLDADNPTRQRFAERIEAKWDRLEAAGKEIHVRMSRFAWYAEWNSFDAADEAETMASVRAASYPY